LIQKFEAGEGFRVRLPEPECSRKDWEGPEEGVDIECYEEEDSEG